METLTIHTGDELVATWRDRAARRLAYPDATTWEQGEACAFNLCADMLNAVLNAARADALDHRLDEVLDAVGLTRPQLAAYAHRHDLNGCHVC
jgi:hypothetical protein